MKERLVSEDFILEAYKEACDEWKRKIRKELPDLFKIEVEKGKWYFENTADIKTLEFVTKVCKDGKIKTYNIHGNKATYESGSIWEEATEEEVTKILTDEAKRRGFVKGVSFKCAWCGDIFEDVEDWDGEFLFIEDEGLESQGFGYPFYKGKWAEILDTMTKKEAQEKLGVRIID